MADGAGLAAGVFNHLLNRGNERPKVIAATHFHGKSYQDDFVVSMLMHSQKYSRASSCNHGRRWHLAT